jgi:hypothetical protein
MVGPDGLPASWRHYRYGLDHLERASSRESLSAAAAMRAAQSSEQNYLDWRRDHKTVGSC